MADDLHQPAITHLGDADSVAALAKREGWSADNYAIQFSEALCVTGLETQRERLAALVSIGNGLAADDASAAELGRHFVILDGLFRRLIIDALQLSGDPRRADASDRMLSGAMKAQRAALACLSALKVLRDTQAFPASPRSPARALPAPDNDKAN